MFHILFDIREHFLHLITKIIDEILAEKKKNAKFLTKRGDKLQGPPISHLPNPSLLTFKQTTSAECWSQRTARG